MIVITISKINVLVTRPFGRQLVAYPEEPGIYYHFLFSECLKMMLIIARKVRNVVKIPQRVLVVFTHLV